MSFFNQKRNAFLGVVCLMAVMPLVALAEYDKGAWLTLFKQGEVKAAIAQLEQDAKEADRNNDATWKGNIYGNMGSLYVRQGKLNDAEKSFKRAIKEHEEGPTKDRFSFGTSYYGLGEFYRKQKRYDEAIVYLEKAVDVLGKGNPGYFMPLQSLGMLYRDQGKYEVAEPLLIQGIIAATQEAEKSGKGESMAILEGFYGLAILYSHQKNYDQAKFALEKALPIATRLKGESSRYATEIQENLTAVNQIVEGLQIVRKLKIALEEGIVARNENKTDVAMAKFINARSLAQTLDNKVAKALWLEISSSHLAMTYMIQGELLKAKQTMEEAIQYNESQNGKNHERAKTYQKGLAKIERLMDSNK